MTTTMTEETGTDHQDVPEAPNPDAPWGYKGDGTPYKVDPAMYAGRQNNGGRKRKATSTRATSSPPRRATPNARKTPAAPDRTRGLLGLVSMASALTVMVGKMLKSKPIMADGLAVIVHGPPVVEAVAELAVDNRQIAAALEHIGKVGPYSALLTAVVPFFLQVAINHKGGKPPEQMKDMFGVMSTDELIAHVAGEPAPAPEGPND